MCQKILKIIDRFLNLTHLTNHLKKYLNLKNKPRLLHGKL
jgi:hypothetical protein